MNKLYAVVLVALLTGCSTVEREHYSAARPEAHVYQKFRGDHCDMCGGTNKLAWAHCFPYNMSTGTLAYLRSSPTNGVTLCYAEHKNFAHYGNFSRYWCDNLEPTVRYVRLHHRLPPDFEEHRRVYVK